MHKELLLNAASFGIDFQWGVSVSAYQIEGAHDADGKGPSIWDTFTGLKGKIKSSHQGSVSCDYYNRYADDIQLLKELNLSNYRFSISWPRLIPEGTGKLNQKGIDFYNRKIDQCLAQNIIPWVTLYHWDLPHALELKGGWTNRDVVGWFTQYTEVCARHFGDRVKHWMVMNEPSVFTGAGYFLGVHAPGRRGLKNFLPAMHHAVLCMGAGGRVLKALLPDAEVGTTFSCTLIEPSNNKPRTLQAAGRIDALLNRMFIEPILGMGYPTKDLKILKKIEPYIKAGDEHLMPFDFDFIGIQNYTREIVKYSFFTPYLQANIVSPKRRGLPVTLMNWEVYAPSIYKMLKKYNNYPQIKRLYVTENGAAFEDKLIDGEVIDRERLDYFQSHLAQVLKAKQEGVNVQGYFIWTLLDNFEWAEGFHPRFGIVHVDFETQMRTIKQSGKWFKDFLSQSNQSSK